MPYDERKQIMNPGGVNTDILVYMIVLSTVFLVIAAVIERLLINLEM